MTEQPNTCRCGKEFVFRRHETSAKSAPIETEPSENGNVEILASGRYRITKGGEGPRYLSHFVHCPFAKGFRQ